MLHGAAVGVAMGTVGVAVGVGVRVAVGVAVGVGARAVNVLSLPFLVPASLVAAIRK